MPENFYQVGPNSTGSKLRYRSRTVGVNTVLEPYRPDQSERVVTYRGMASTFRTIGSGSTTHGLFYIRNTLASTVYVAIRRVDVQMDATALLTTVPPVIEMHLYTGDPSPTGGTALVKGSADTALTTSAEVGLRTAANLDGGGGNIPSPTGGTFVRSWQSFTSPLPTAVGQRRNREHVLLPSLAQKDPVILRPGIGELAYVRVAAVNAADNPGTNDWIVNCAWDEYTL